MMSDSWNRLHRRHELVHAVLDAIASRGKPDIPARFVSAVDAEFGDLGGFLREVQSRWYRAFDARLDMLLEHEPTDLPAAIADLWRGLADTMPAARRLLDAHAAHPALVAGDEHHRRTLRYATGIHHDSHTLVG
jgi:hypothetical protein